MGSNIRFGITSDLSGLSQGIIVNSIAKNNTTESAQARDQLGNVIDIAAFSDDKNVTIDGLYVSQSLKPGTIINVNNQTYMVVSTGREESNTAFQTASINARLFPGDEPPTPPGPIIPNPSLMFKGVDDQGSYIQLNQIGSPDAVELVYRKNNSEWITYNIGDIIALNRDDVVFLSGANDHFSKSIGNFYYFTIDGQVEASGNIQSLINFSDSCTWQCFYRLFSDCDDLLTAPDLPATGLASRCYTGMFQGCTSLTSTPALPASTLAYGCYRNMFRNCTSLSTAPQLPATGLANYCYESMFRECTSLTSFPDLPATTLAKECYTDMFWGCSAVVNPPKISATILAEYEQYGCMQNMFNNCSSLISIYLPATTLTNGCYNSMFAGCRSLTSINVDFTEWGNTLLWTIDVAPTGIFYKPNALPEIYNDVNYQYIPSGWTVINKDQ